MRRKQLITTFFILMAIFAVIGCSKKPSVAGDYGIIISEEFKKKTSEMALAFTKNDPKMKAEFEKQLKNIDVEAAKVTVTFKDDGKCIFSTPNKPAETVDYTLAENKVTIKSPRNSLANSSGKDMVLTWDEAKGTLTAGPEAMGLILKKK